VKFKLFALAHGFEFGFDRGVGPRWLGNLHRTSTLLTILEIRVWFVWESGPKVNGHSARKRIDEFPNHGGEIEDHTWLSRVVAGHRQTFSHRAGHAAGIEEDWNNAGFAGLNSPGPVRGSGAAARRPDFAISST
jgi:hypothetical protein